MSARRALSLGLWLALLLPGQAPAQSPEEPPPPRPAAFAPTKVSTLGLPRPQPRPALALASPAEPVRAWTVPRPKPRPQGMASEVTPEVILAAAPAPEPQPRVQTPTLKGAVCGRPEIKGRQLAALRGRHKGCGIADPVEVTSIAGVTISPAATINCAAAEAISSFVTGSLQPAFDHQVTGLQIADSYACRPRNNVRGNKVSVHGKGEAIDFTAAVLASGKVVPVKSRLDKRWQKARKTACGIFSVILGPGSDGYHETHIHMDVSNHGGRPYCR